MKKIWLAVLLTLVAAQTLFAQNDTTYFSKDHTFCKRKEAESYRLVYQYDSLHFQIRDYWINGNKKTNGFTKTFPESYSFKKEGKYFEFYKNGNMKENSNYVEDELVGTQKLYFQNGKIYKVVYHSNKKDDNKELLPPVVKEVWDSLGHQLVKDGFGKSKEFSQDLEAIEEGIYKNGIKDSVWTGCYINGKLCYRETYQQGKLLDGLSNDTLGVAHSYKEVHKNPEFNGGMKKFAEFLGKNLEYPLDAHRLGISGKIFIKFVVEKDGSVKDLFVLKGIYHSLEEEALRVLRKTSKKWTPGENRGLLVRVYFTIPIVFQLE